MECNVIQSMEAGKLSWPFWGFVQGNLAKLTWKRKGKDRSERAWGIWISFIRQCRASEDLGARD